jgi:hypothetical protein
MRKPLCQCLAQRAHAGCMQCGCNCLRVYRQSEQTQWLHALVHDMQMHTRRLIKFVRPPSSPPPHCTRSLTAARALPPPLRAHTHALLRARPCARGRARGLQVPARVVPRTAGLHVGRLHSGGAPHAHGPLSPHVLTSPHSHSRPLLPQCAACAGDRSGVAHVHTAPRQRNDGCGRTAPG